MKDIKLIRTLKSFSSEEMKLFEKFAASPFFNNGRNYLPLLTELKKFLVKNGIDNLSYEIIYKKLYPGKNFNKQVMWNLVSGLEKLALEFLLQTALKSSKRERSVLMFDELLKRNLDREIFSQIQKTEKYLSGLKYGREYFSIKYTAENNKCEYWNLAQGRQDKSLEGTVNSAEYLMLNLVTELSVIAWDLHVMLLTYNSGKELNSAIELINSLDLKKLVSIAKKNKSKYADIINFYYNKIMCATDESNESYFFEMKEYFEYNHELFDIQEQRNTIITLANYCALKMRSGNEKFLKILFEINKFRLKSGIENLNGRINKALYHQILRNALSLGEVKWSENFIKEYTTKLKKEHQKTMNFLARGYLSYAKKDYADSLENLNKVDFIDLRDKLHVRILSAKAYYELGSSETLFYYIDTSKHFIGNNSFLEKETKEAYLRFFNFLNKLLICKENPEIKKLKKLNEDIHFDRSLRKRHKDWLIEKTDNLIQ